MDVRKMILVIALSVSIIACPVYAYTNSYTSTLTVNGCWDGAQRSYSGSHIGITLYNIHLVTSDNYHNPDGFAITPIYHKNIFVNTPLSRYETTVGTASTTIMHSWNISNNGTYYFEFEKQHNDGGQYYITSNDVRMYSW